MSGEQISRLSRYMSFERFEDICASGLFLANPTFFDDKQEGYVAVKTIYPGAGEGELEQIEIMKSYFYISSWYAGIKESREMRNQYGEICIETSWEKLKTISKGYGENNQTHNIILGAIQYVGSSDNRIGDKSPNWSWDYWDEKNYNPQCVFNFRSIKTLQGLFFKHDKFSYEKEVRLICDSFHGGNQGVTLKNAKRGIRVPLNADFYSKIVLSTDNLKDRVAEVLKKYSYESEIVCLG